MENLIEKKKEEKRKNLLQASYRLFTTRGISKVSIADICKEASIAKGTFYLYFSSKEEIARALNKDLSHTVLQRAYACVVEDRKPAFKENLLTMSNFLLDYCSNDTDTLLLMSKDFILPFTIEDFQKSSDPLFVDLHNEIENYAKKTGISFEEILFRLYALLSMIISVCYSFYFDHYPSNVDLDTLRKYLNALVSQAFTES